MERAPADAVEILDGAAEKGFETGAGPDHLGFTRLIDRGFVDEAGGQFGHGAIAELAFAQRIAGLLALGDVHRHAHQPRELAGGWLGDGAVLHFHPADLAVRPADLHQELDGLAGEITLRARDARFFPAFAHMETLPAEAPVLLLVAAVDALGAMHPLELVDSRGVHDVLVHRARGQIGDRAVARVVQQQDAFVCLAPGDVARMRDDAHHGGIAERIDRDALQPAPAAVAMTEAVLEAVQVLRRDLRGHDCAESFAHRVGVIRVQEFGGVAA